MSRDRSLTSASPRCLPRRSRWSRTPEPEPINRQPANRALLLRFLRAHSDEDFDDMSDAVVNGEDAEDAVFERLVDEFLETDAQP